MNIKEFILELPQKLHPSVIEGHNTSFHFDITGEGGGQYTVNIADGICTSAEGMEGEAKCKVTSSVETLNGLLDKSINPMMAVFSGKLKISNQGEMLKYAKIFGLM